MDISKYDIKIGPTTHKIEDVSPIRCFSVLNPEGAILFNIQALDGCDGVENRIVGRNSTKPKRMGLVTHKPNELMEIDTDGAPYAALSTGQAVPYGLVRRVFKFVKRALNNLPG
jgi:hypothetical protein